MKGIDGLLSIAVRQEATELRLASNKPPRLFRGADELPLTMPPITAEALLALLGDISSHEAALREKGMATFAYHADAGDFDVTLNRRADDSAGDLYVRIVRRAAARKPATAAREASPAHAAAPGIAPPRPETRTGPTREARIPAEIASVLEQAAKLGASDVHLTQDLPPTVRVVGQLRPLDAEPVDVAGLLPDPALLDRVLAGRAVDLGLDLPGLGRLRVNVYNSADGLAAAIRLLRREAPRLAELRLPPVVHSLVELPHGLVLVCGPTGSGKSTTLAALAQEALRLRPHLLITLEDPIEYRIVPVGEGCLVRQREIGRHVTDFATGLRDALREDPDILLIGEMRDAETIGLALTAAETGHLVLASLHSRTSASAIERIVDTYPPERQRQIRVQLADALRAVVAQRLLPRADGSGRLAVVEFLRVHQGVANLIREGKTPQITSAIQAGGEDGMIPFERNLAELVRNNSITLAAARAVAADNKMLDDYLGARR